MRKLNEIERWNTALMIAIRDLENPNKETRDVATDSGVTVEFMEIRERLIEHAHGLFAFDRSSPD